jgi:hypothetical protein
VVCLAASLSRNAHAESSKREFKPRNEYWRWLGGARGVVGIDAAQDFEASRGVCDAGCDRADLIERTRVGDEAPPAHASVRRLDSDEPAEGSGLTDAASRVGAEREGRDARDNTSG